jgi:hypothetical protein
MRNSKPCGRRLVRLPSPHTLRCSKLTSLYTAYLQSPYTERLYICLYGLRQPIFYPCAAVNASLSHEGQGLMFASSPAILLNSIFVGLKPCLIFAPLVRNP